MVAYLEDYGQPPPAADINRSFQALRAPMGVLCSEGVGIGRGLGGVAPRFGRVRLAASLQGSNGDVVPYRQS